uniref:Protein kish-B n=1 Tax=Suricata suricatta TaxID=37032 RepID=A0A673TRV9_SURSU
MTNVYSLDGILVFGLLFVCTCAYFKKVPRLKTWLLSEKKGVWGVFYKGKIVAGWGVTDRCDRNQAARCRGNRLCCNGLLRPVCKMNSKAPISSAANQEDEGEEPVWGLGPV